MVYYITKDVEKGKFKGTYYLWYDEDSKKPYPQNFGLTPQTNKAVNENVLYELNQDNFLYVLPKWQKFLSVHENPLKFLDQYMTRAYGWNDDLTHVETVKDIPYFKNK